MNDFQCKQLVVILFDRTTEIQARVSGIGKSIFYRWSCKWTRFVLYLLYTILHSFHSRNEHIFGFLFWIHGKNNCLVPIGVNWFQRKYLAKIVVMSSRVIFFFTLSGYAWYHFWRRSFPCRLNRSMNCIILLNVFQFKCSDLEN